MTTSPTSKIDVRTDSPSKRKQLFLQHVIFLSLLLSSRGHYRGKGRIIDHEKKGKEMAEVDIVEVANACV